MELVCKKTFYKNFYIANLSMQKKTLCFLYARYVYMCAKFKISILLIV